LFQEAAKLEEQGYLAPAAENSWALGSVTSDHQLDRQVAGDVERLLQRFEKYDADRLIRYVYPKYPEFTVNSRIKRHAERTVAPLAVYTSGYEGLSVDAFLNRLVTTGVQHLIDVRHNPIARRYGFHKSTLKRLCENLGIRYSHVPKLGIHSSKRQSLDTQQDYDQLFREYRATTLRAEQESIAQVASDMKNSPSVLVCMEATHDCCHRSHLATVVAKQTGLPISHLE
jgi:uncharacterized protein (DUF488 family)